MGSEVGPEKRYMAYMRILFTDMATMHSMLTELSPSFVICHRYNEMGDPERATEMGDFIAPNKYLASMISDALVKSVHKRAVVNESLPFEGAERMAARFQHKLDTIDSMYC